MAPAHRWTEITPSGFAHEREALDLLRDRLPDQEPFFGWSNFEFVADNGGVNEIDALVLSSHTLYLVEIKSRPGRLEGDMGTWTWSSGSRSFADDNPYLLANRKAKRLKSLLARQDAYRRGHQSVPFIAPAIFLSAADLDCRLSPDGREGVCLREAHADRPSIHDLLAGDQGGAAVRGHRRLDREARITLQRALEQAGIRPSVRDRQVGDYVLDRLIGEHARFQDWEGHHASLKRQRGRIRIYAASVGAAADDRAAAQRAAEREFTLTQRIHHPGVVRTLGFQDLERGPAVVFEHPEGIERLDRYLRGKGATIDHGTRMRLVRQVAEALQYAHGQRVVHRALGPQSVYVLHRDGEQPAALIADWQLGHREGGTTSAHGAEMDVGMLGELVALVFQAPEVVGGMGADGIKADVYSLGALAYYLLTGQPPALSFPAMRELIVAGPGLQLAGFLDGAGQGLQDLVQDATRPNPLDRPEDVAEFLQKLDEAERERDLPAKEVATIHPAEAQAGDELPGGFVVQRRLGKGATSVAYAVERDGKSFFMKVALAPAQNERLRAEAAMLEGLRHPNIVALKALLELPGGPAGPHVALLLAASGDGETLAKRLRKEGALSLDMLGRFGTQLLETLTYLEEQGGVHRDIKPDNIAIGATRTKTRTLILFDFSLASAALTDLQAGTPPYRDPFLPRRRRFDAHAERYAAAVTLHEMATGVVPTSDGDPELTNIPVAVAADRLDPALREDLGRFLARALAPDIQHRFPSAGAMLGDWKRIFADAERPSPGHGDGLSDDVQALKAWQRLIREATSATPLVKLGLNARLLNAAERLGASTVGELQALPRGRFYQAAGIGLRTLKELRELTETVGEAQQEGADALALDAHEPARWPLDKVHAQALKIQLAPDMIAHLRAVLGVDERVSDMMPTLRDAATATGSTRSVLAAALEAAADRWEKGKWMGPLRQQLDAILTEFHGIATAAEVAAALLASRGSASVGDSRMREAMGVLAAAIEVEANRDTPRFALFRDQLAWVVAADGADERLAYARRLGERADELAGLEPLATPVRAQEALREVPLPPDEPVWPAERLFAVAVGASRTAAVSSRLEIYPREMPARRALVLAAGALIGPSELRPEEIQRRVASRYPEAVRLPSGLPLQALLEEYGLGWSYDPLAGLFRAPRPSVLHGTGSTSTTIGPPAVGLDLADFEARLRRVAAERRFLVVTVRHKEVSPVSRALAAHGGLALVDLDRAFLLALKAVAATQEVDWTVVLGADGAADDHEDHRNLRILAADATTQLLADLLSRPRPLLLRHAGLLARYGGLGLLADLRAACVDGNGPGAVLVLGADDRASLPAVDRVVLPVVDSADWTPLPAGWLLGASLTTPVATGAGPG